MLPKDIINTRRTDHEAMEMIDAEFNYFAREVDQDFSGYNDEDVLEYDSVDSYEV